MLTDRLPAAAGPLVLVLVLAGAAGASAQAAVPGQAQPKPAPRPGGEHPPVDLSISRIRRMLGETPPTKISATPSLLKLDFYVDVVGKKPRIDFFKDFDIGRGTPVQYGGMTHDEFMRVTGPPWRRRF